MLFLIILIDNPSLCMQPQSILICIHVCMNTSTSVYLSCEIQGGGLGNCTVHLPKHLTELRHHGSKVMEQSLHRLLKDGTHSLRNNNTRSAIWTGLIMWSDLLESRGTWRFVGVCWSDSPLQPASRWATYWAQSVWEQTLVAKPPPPEKHHHFIK